MLCWIDFFFFFLLEGNRVGNYFGVGKIELAGKIYDSVCEEDFIESCDLHVYIILEVVRILRR